MHVIPSATIRGRDPFSLAKTATVLGYGVAKAWLKLGSIKPAIVVGFGGYPSIPTVLAASLRGIPTLIHGTERRDGPRQPFSGGTGERYCDRICPACFDKNAALAAKATHTGNPVRPMVILAATRPYSPPDATGPLHLLVFGGSQGARVMSEILPAAIEQLNKSLRKRLNVVQQARQEDLDGACAKPTHRDSRLLAEIEPFFSDLPARMAASQLVIGRSGASTVAELAAIGLSSILVPLPHALDQDQRANAGILERAGGAIRLKQDIFTPGRVAAELAALAAAPAASHRHGQGGPIGRRHRCRRAARRSGAAGGWSDEGKRVEGTEIASRSDEVFLPFVPAQAGTQGYS